MTLLYLAVMMIVCGALVSFSVYCVDFARIYKAERLSGRSALKAFGVTFLGESHFKPFAKDSRRYYEARNAKELKDTDIYLERYKMRSCYRLPDGRIIYMDDPE